MNYLRSGWNNATPWICIVPTFFVFNHFLLIDATDWSKISGCLIRVSRYPLNHFLRTLPLRRVTDFLNNRRILKSFFFFFRSCLCYNLKNHTGFGFERNTFLSWYFAPCVDPHIFLIYSLCLGSWSLKSSDPPSVSSVSSSQFSSHPRNRNI